jgi:hypothetical protein
LGCGTSANSYFSLLVWRKWLFNIHDVCGDQMWQIIEEILTISVTISTEIPSKNKHWCVPRSVNTLFTGRTDILQRIESDLTTTTDLGQQRRFVITGIGGQGKSEICLKVADLVRERYV